MFAAIDQSVAARVLMGDSLGFHILFALLGVGLPLLLSIGEWYGLRHKNTRLLRHVELWSRVAVILAVAGVASGTIIALQMSLMWPHFMAIAGPVVGPAFLLEGYSFLLEAIFLAFYMVTWRKIKGYKHWLLTLPIIAGALMSAIFITTVNAWMTDPRGFVMTPDGPAQINHLAAMFSWTGFWKITHSVAAYYATTVLLVAGIYGWLYLRGRMLDRKFYQWVAQRLFWLGALLLLIVGGLGHFSGVYLGEAEPRKLAAYELQYETESHAPFTIGGTLNPDTGEVTDAIEIPWLLSILSGGSPDAIVQGLEDTPRAEWPPLYVHALYGIKMTLAMGATAIVLLIAVYPWLRRWKWLARAERPVWYVGLSAGVICVAVIEIGWAMTEIARQPWTVVGSLLTRDAFTRDNDVIALGYAFPISYVVLIAVTTAAAYLVIRRTTRKIGNGL